MSEVKKNQIVPKEPASWGQWEQRTEYIELPELNELFGVAEDQVVVFKIRQANLDEMIRAQSQDSDPEVLVRKLATSLNLGRGEDAIDTIADYFNKLHPNTEYELRILKSCVLEPKLNHFDVRHLQELFPVLCNKLSSRIMALSAQGGVKKNLTSSS